MEECGELIQECCKMMRKNDFNSEAFTNEVGDVIALLRLAQAHGLYDESKALEAAGNKMAKLKKWSNLVDF